jgi:hypothetical protein
MEPYLVVPSPWASTITQLGADQDRLHFLHGRHHLSRDLCGRLFGIDFDTMAQNPGEALRSGMLEKQRQQAHVSN